MKRTSLALVCALAGACALPVTAQMASTPAKAEAKAKATPTGKERARLAKAQNKPDCKVAKQDKPKKASAT